jgi:hypothetical protein
VIENSLIEIQTKTLHTGTPSSTIPSNGSVLYIANYAFEYSTVSNIVLPDCIKSIGTNAFARCNNLTEINIPAGCILNATCFA